MLRSHLVSFPSFILFLALFAGVVSALTLPGVWGSSEAREIQVVQSILRNGDWVLPLRNGIIPSKPPFFHWVAGSLAGVLGEVTPWGVRAVSALSACLVLLCVYAIGVLLGGPRNGRAIGVVSICITLLSPSFLRLAVDARVDMTLLAAVTAAVTFGVAGIVSAEAVISRPRRVPLWSILGIGLCTGIGTLVKGPLAIIVVALVLGVVVTSSWGRRAMLENTPRAIVTVVVVSCLAIPWYYGAVERGEGAFLSRLFFENFSRFSGAEETNAEPWWFYLPSFLLNLAPWSWLFLHFGWKRVSARLRPPTIDGRVMGLGVSILLMLFFLSLSVGKRHSYLVLTVPFLACFVGAELVRYWEGSSQFHRYRMEQLSRVLLRGMACIALLGLFGVELLHLPLEWGEAGAYAQEWIILNRSPVQFALGLLVLGGFFPLARGAAAAVFVSTALAVSTLVFVGLALGFGLKSEFKGFARMAAEVHAHVPKEAQLLAFKDKHDEYFDPLFMELNREVDVRTLPIQQAVQGFLLLRLSEFERCQRVRCLGEELLQVRATLRQPIDVIERDDSRTIVLLQVGEP